MLKNITLQKYYQFLHHTSTHILRLGSVWISHTFYHYLLPLILLYNIPCVAKITSYKSSDKIALCFKVLNYC